MTTPVEQMNTSSRRPFKLNGTTPENLFVTQTSPPEHATKLYSVIASYGWAEKILCSECYVQDANDIATAIGEKLGIRVSLAQEPIHEPITA